MREEQLAAGRPGSGGIKERRRKMQCQAMIWEGLGNERPCPNEAEPGSIYCQECIEWKPEEEEEAMRREAAINAERHAEAFDEIWQQFMDGVNRTKEIDHEAELGTQSQSIQRNVP